MFKFIKPTIVGGALFLVPIVILVVILGKAMAFVRVFTDPLVAALPFPPLLARLAVDALAILGLLLVCLLAGLAARTRAARRAVAALEANILQKVPAYALIKTMVSAAVAAEEAANPMQPVMVHFDDLSQIGLEVERFPPDKVCVFLPGAPNPWSGSLCVVATERVTSLDMTLNEFATLHKQAGVGAAALLAPGREKHRA
jgi:uncharacterized membrane protein